MGRIHPRGTRNRSERGQALVETAVILPIVLVVLLAIFEFGKLLNYKLELTQAARDGARWAAVNRNPGPGVTLADSIVQSLDTQDIRSRAQASICSFGNNVGDRVRVTVTVPNYDIFPIYGGLRLNGVTSFTITSKADMRLEQVPTTAWPACT